MEIQNAMSKEEILEEIDKILFSLNNKKRSR